MPAYDPDSDGDNDAQSALGFLQSAASLIESAIDCLTGDDEEEDGEGAEDGNTGAAPGNPVVPGASVDGGLDVAEINAKAAARDARLRLLKIAEAESL